MKYTYTQRDKRKLIKKVIGKSIYEALPIKMTKNCRYTKEELIDTILFSVANNISVEYGSKRMKEMKMKVPSGDEVFHHLDKLKMEEVLSAFYKVNSDILKRKRRKRALCAIDVHKIPYYGKNRDKHIVGMENARGTSYGYAYASIDCVNTKEPFTLAALPLYQLTTKKEMITELVNRAKKYVDISRIFLDRGFFNIESIETLIDLKVPFIIPAVKNKRIKKKIEEAHTKSKHILCTESYVFVTEYTMKKGKHSVTVKLVVILELKGNEWKEFAYVTNMDVTLENGLLLANSYRSRWRIETGYRVKEKVRGKTCSRNYSVRLLLQLLSILLYNLWCKMRIETKVIMDEFKDLILDYVEKSHCVKRAPSSKITSAH